MKNVLSSIYITIVTLCIMPSVTYSQVAVDISTGNVRVQAGKGGSSVAVNKSGVIDSDDVDMEGVAIINNKVFIDGEEIPKGKSNFFSKKTKKRYSINWNKDGSVAVSEK